MIKLRVCCALPNISQQELQRHATASMSEPSDGTTTASMRRLLLQKARLLRPSDASDSSPRTSTPSRTRCRPAAQNWTLDGWLQLWCLPGCHRHA